MMMFGEFNNHALWECLSCHERLSEFQSIRREALFCFDILKQKHVGEDVLVICR